MKLKDIKHNYIYIFDLHTIFLIFCEFKMIVQVNYNWLFYCHLWKMII